MNLFKNIFTKDNKARLSNESVTDIDGNVYKTVKIGKQIWITDNLKTLKFKNGNPIPKDYYQNAYFENEYHIYYNWHSVNDLQGLAPEGWHIPNSFEWQILVKNLGGKNKAIDKLRSSYGWHKNSNGNNKSGFNALPLGRNEFYPHRNEYFHFGLGEEVFIWTNEKATMQIYESAYVFYVGASGSRIHFENGKDLSRLTMFSIATTAKSIKSFIPVRCLKD